MDKYSRPPLQQGPAMRNSNREQGKPTTHLSPVAAIVIIIMIALVGTILHAWLGQSWTSTSGHAIGSDDAYISYRYAKNFFDGYGLVFNPGDRVEGYSNFFYTILMVPAFYISIDAVYIYSVFINCTLLGITIYAFYAFLKSELSSENKALLGAFILATNPWVWANSATGLETILILSITTISWICIENFIKSKNGYYFFGVLFLSLLSICSRVDGFILPLTLAGYALIKNEKNLAIKIITVSLLVAIAYTAFRYFYYSDFIANTYYNKVSGNVLSRIKSGFKFFIEYSAKTGFWIPLLLIATKAIFYLPKRKYSDFFSFPIFFITLWSIYLVWIGGDIYFERFFVALFPMGVYITINFIFDNTRTKLLPIAIAFIVSIQSAYAFKDGRFSYEANKYDGWIETGKFLKEKYPGATIAIDAAGKVPFFSNLKTIDMLGLNDRHIGKMKVSSQTFYPGHTKFDPEYVLSLNPDLIIAWTDKEQNLGWGMTKSTYGEAYSLKYLINLSRKNKYPNNIIDITRLPESEISRLISSDYNYAILIKGPSR